MINPIPARWRERSDPIFAAVYLIVVFGLDLPSIRHGGSGFRGRAGFRPCRFGCRRAPSWPGSPGTRP
jgi:hypothetical protein